MNIYLAGKISSADWRMSIVPRLEAACRELGGVYSRVPIEENLRWPTLPDSIFDEHNYTGPFFTFCDREPWHCDTLRCYFGDNQHGVGASPAYAYAQDPEASLCVQYDSTNGSWPRGDKWDIRASQHLIREKVLRSCFAAVAASDAVFAWITGTDCFGTIAEIGMAYALGVPVWIAHPKDQPVPEDLWFAWQCAADTRHAESARDGLRFALAECAKHPDYWLMKRHGTTTEISKARDLREQVDYLAGGMEQIEREASRTATSGNAAWRDYIGSAVVRPLRDLLKVARVKL